MILLSLERPQSSETFGVSREENEYWLEQAIHHQKLLEQKTERNLSDRLQHFVRLLSKKKDAIVVSDLLEEPEIEFDDTLVDSQLTASVSGQYRLDTYVPDKVYQNQIFDLAVALRKPSSPLLTESDLSARSTDIHFSASEPKSRFQLKVDINAPDCEIKTS